MFEFPDTIILRFFSNIATFLGNAIPPPNFAAPLFQQKRNPFAQVRDVPLGNDHPAEDPPLWQAENNGGGANGIDRFEAAVPPHGVVSNVTTNDRNAFLTSRHPKLQNVRASDYVTPQKYLDGAEIPAYYSFQSNMIPPEDWKHGMLPFLEVDRRLTVPTRTHIRFLVTATDVLHSWSLPSLNLKADALPARVTRMNTFILREGVFYGQCSEMCGSLHGFMPIVLEAVSPEAYAAHAKKFYRE